MNKKFIKYVPRNRLKYMFPDRIGTDEIIFYSNNKQRRTILNCMYRKKPMKYSYYDNGVCLIVRRIK